MVHKSERKFKSTINFIIFYLFLCVTLAQDEIGHYNIGTGIGDITGPAAGVALNGFFNPMTLAAGIHTRLYARSFIVESITTGKRVVFVSCDLGMFDHGLKLEVVKKLQAIYRGKYSEQNVMISATNTHNGPSGFMQYYVYSANESYGFNPLTFWAIVEGVVESVEKADRDLSRGRIFLNKGELFGYNENRRGDAYMENPEEEREMYEHDVDKEMISLKFETFFGNSNTNAEPIGSFNWWPVHPTSFSAWNNTKVSSDTTGYASVRFDYEMNKGESGRPGRGKFVAAFAASNLGDVKPNIPFPDKVKNKLDEVAAVGQALFEKAFELFNDRVNRTLVTGPIDFVQQYVNMTEIKVEVTNPNGESETHSICKAAIGYSYLGLEPGQMAFWDTLLSRVAVEEPSEEIIECQRPKEIALPVGEMNDPWDWVPSIVDLNIFRIGTVVIVSVPGELTTMAGRRLKRSIEALVAEDHHVIIAGLANNYINYIVTPEEYSQTPKQGNESGATLFGKYTLNAIIQSQEFLMKALNSSEPVDRGPIPPNYIDEFPNEFPNKILPRVDKIPPIPTNAHWGDVVTSPPNVVYSGEDLVVRFISPSLRHNALRNQSHFLIEIKKSDTSWMAVRTDADVDTTFLWNAYISWGEVRWFNIPTDIPFGVYRVCFSGYYLNDSDGVPIPFDGNTQPFQIIHFPIEETTWGGVSSLNAFAMLFVILIAWVAGNLSLF